MKNKAKTLKIQSLNLKWFLMYIIIATDLMHRIRMSDVKMKTRNYYS